MHFWLPPDHRHRNMFKSNSEGSLYGEKLQFYGVTGKAGGTLPLSPIPPVLMPIPQAPRVRDQDHVKILNAKFTIN